MTRTIERKIFQKINKLERMQSEIKFLKKYIFKIYPQEEKELFEAYHEIISGKTATLSDLVKDLKKDKIVK